MEEKQTEVKRRREKNEERDSGKGANKASECYSYVLFIYSNVLFKSLLQRSAQLLCRQKARERHVADTDLDKEAAHI